MALIYKEQYLISASENVKKFWNAKRACYAFLTDAPENQKSLYHLFFLPVKISPYTLPLNNVFFYYSSFSPFCLLLPKIKADEPFARLP